jgi:hypothetical protein
MTFDWKTVASDEGAVACGEAVAVPNTGDWVVRDGVIRKVSIDIVTPGVAYAYGEWSSVPDDD